MPSSRKSQRSTPKVQRWIDLIAALLVRRYPVTFEELGREVPAYGDATRSKETREKQFERDKDELRAYGVPIETVVDDDTARYQLDRRSFYLPYLTVTGTQGSARPSRADAYRAATALAFEPDELAVVSEAAARVRALDDPTLAAHAESAMRKLAFDLPVDAVQRDAADVAPVREAPDPAVLETLGDALRARKRATFTYHAMGRDATERRTVEPWGMFYLSGHWYLTGRDVERGDGREGLRTFRVSRVRDVEWKSGARHTPDYAVPADFRLRDHARSRQAWELGDGDGESVDVAFREETGATAPARQLGEAIEGCPDRRRFRVRRRDTFLRWLLAFAGDAVPVAPPELVVEWHALIDRTRAVHGAAR